MLQRTRRPPASEASAHSAVMMTFVLSLSVGIAISVLLGWHLYLILTAQTTIDFYQNQTNRARARQWGEVGTTALQLYSISEYLSPPYMLHPYWYALIHAFVASGRSVCVALYYTRLLRISGSGFRTFFGLFLAGHGDYCSARQRLIGLDLFPPSIHV